MCPLTALVRFSQTMLTQPPACFVAVFCAERRFECVRIVLSQKLSSDAVEWRRAEACIPVHLRTVVGADGAGVVQPIEVCVTTRMTLVSLLVSILYYTMLYYAHV